MPALKTILIILAITAFLFVPFYPFRLIKRFIFGLLNRLLPLPIKFDDIGGVPIVGIRLFNVRITLRGESTLVAREMRIRINLWQTLFLRRPTIDPIAFFDPIIDLHREKERGEIWFLFPLNIARRVAGFLFANLWGTNKVRIHNGQIVLHGNKGDTVITHLNALFLAQGGQAIVRSLSCRIGQGVIQMTPLGPGFDSDVRISAHELPLDNLTALKVPRQLTGLVEIEAVMKGGFTTPVIDGDIRSSCIYLREQPIHDVHSPLHFEGTTMVLTHIQGQIADYRVTGSLTGDVVTDRVHLKLEGGGTGRGPGLIFQMINMKPYIATARFDGRIDLEGDFEVFTDITGLIDVRLKEVRLNPPAFTQKNIKVDTALPRVPELNFDMFMQEGCLFIESMEGVTPGARVNISGRIDMDYDMEREKVTDTFYDFNVRVKEDNTYPHDPDPARTLRLPMYFDGKVKFGTHATADPNDFRAGGSMVLNDVSVQRDVFAFLGKLGDFIEIYFRSVRGEMDFTATGMTLKNVHVGGTWLELLVNGVLGFNGALDVSADARVLPFEENGGHAPWLRMPRHIADYFRAGFRITGTTRHPRVKIKAGG